MPHDAESFNPFERDDHDCVVLVNAEEQYSLRPQQITVPAGWAVVRGPSPKAECQAYIEQIWIDMRSLGLRVASTVTGVV